MGDCIDQMKVSMKKGTFSLTKKTLGICLKGTLNVSASTLPTLALTFLMKGDVKTPMTLIDPVRPVYSLQARKKTLSRTLTGLEGYNHPEGKKKSTSDRGGLLWCLAR